MAKAEGERLLRLVQAGDLGFDEYARRTLSDWTGMASWLRRRWSMPRAVEMGDVLQELLTAAWEAIGRWDPTRGVEIGAFVRWRAIVAASYWIHCQRSARERKARGASRHDLAGGSPAEVMRDEWDARASAPASQLGLMLWAERFRLELAKLDADERVVVLSVGQTFDPAEVARAYYGDAEFRRRRRWGCEAEARRFVHRTLVQMAGEER